MTVKTAVRRCTCHRADEHRCPGLTKLRNFAIRQGRLHIEEGRLVGGPAPVKPVTQRRNNRKASK
jgi:hypothetical protein